MTNQQLETFLFQYTESEQRHLREQPPQLSPRYRNIPKVVYNGREMYQFNFRKPFEKSFGLCQQGIPFYRYSRAYPLGD